jgi:aerobic carbon-monoxide dehydrogenase large subunit
VRGWDNMPVVIGNGHASRGNAAGAATGGAAAAAASAATVARGESWELTLQTPMGPQVMTAQIVRDGAQFKGTMTGEMGVEQINGNVSGNALSWTLSLKKPVSIKLAFDAIVEGNSMSGSVKLGMFGKAQLSGKRI